MATLNYNISNYYSSYYTVTGNGVSGANPTISVTTGDMIIFNVSAAGHPVLIKTAPGTGTNNLASAYTTNNGATSGTIQVNTTGFDAVP